MNETTVTTVKAAIAAAVATMTALWGWFGWLVIAWVLLMLADWLIGSILGHIPAVSLPFTYSVLLGPLVIVWYIIGELGSLAEHAVTFGAPVPSWLRNILEIGKNAVDAAGESIAGEGGGDDPKESENTKNE